MKTIEYRLIMLLGVFCFTLFTTEIYFYFLDNYYLLPLLLLGIYYIIYFIYLLSFAKINN
jgi:hypothetical protein